MGRKRSLFFSHRDRSCGFAVRADIRRNLLGSEYLVKRLKCEHIFVGHEGCVNTVAWNDCGDIILSGSDDCKLNIYRLTSMKPVHSIPSGHRANVFSAKFLPCTGDTKIVSCSGDGVLHYNDVNGSSFYGQSPFHCHSGTTYEVNTTPGDPHSFLSSGEDGTVRLFDLRSKTKCVCEGCQEDVLIDCGKAVTSFSVNPVYPYYIAVGCENSMLRVYDRRFMTTDRQGKGKEHGFLCQFKPKALEKRNCRVTSLKYSADGQSLLASFCSDYVYLFDSNPKSTSEAQGADNPNEETDGCCSHAGNDPPMKRLRLRGDWSDTGPNARPESEDSGNNENSFIQRMSGYLTRWIADSMQNNRRQRRSNNPTAVRSPPEESTEQSNRQDENPDFLTADQDDTAPSGENSQSSRDNPETGTSTEAGVADVSNIMDTGNSLQDAESSQRTASTEMGHAEQSCNSDDKCRNGGKSCTAQHGESDRFSGGPSSVTVSPVTGNKTRGSKASKEISRRGKKYAVSSACENDKIRNSTTEDGNSIDATCSLSTSGGCHGNKEANQGTSDDDLIDDSALTDNSNEESFQGSEMSTEEVTSGNQMFESRTDPGSGIPETGSRARGTQSSGVQVTAQEESETGVTSVRTRTEEPHRQTGVGGSSASEADDSDRRNAAANAIQNFFRHRHKKNLTSSDYEVPRDRMFTEARRIYKGHRNARTMIKEANFWGDDFVLSGSDCGRVFIWSRHTAKLVMLLEADRHVVNCVQPHPYDPILATSGIDYDVKLWTPTALDVSRMEDAKEVVARNEKMLKESRDTLTVPASFMIRVLSSLHRVRFHGMGNDETPTDSDSDSNDDE